MSNKIHGMRPTHIENNFEQMSAELADALKALLIDGAEKIRDTKSYVILRKHGTDCNIEARFEQHSPTDCILDANGNEYVEFGLDIRVTYPTHGGADIETAENRARFILDCCAAATRVKNQFYGKMVCSLWRSKEEKAKRQQELAKEAILQAAKRMLKGMRVGAEKVFCADNLIPGTYELEFDKKFYTAVVADDKPITITRTK